MNGLETGQRRANLRRVQLSAVGLERERTMRTSIANGATLAALVLLFSIPAAAQPYLCVPRIKYEAGKKTQPVVKAVPCGPKQHDISDSFKGQPSADIYGDGSAGALNIASDTTLNTTDHPNPQYTDITIDAGRTLTVPSGTVLRCTGSFTNNGTISVQTFAAGGRIAGIDASTAMPAMRIAHPGVAKSAAMNPEYGDDTAIQTGGSGGARLTEYEALHILMPGAAAGGGGGAAGINDSGVSGGGSLVVLCRGAISNNGVITANGASGGGGGGAGGILVLASAASVTNGAPGIISANGAAGAASDTNEGPSGGGGGGIVHLLAPVITIANAANVTVNGGAAGSGAENVTLSPRTGGAGGGACGGAGGNGGNVSADDSVTAATAGGAGYVLQSLVDPAALF